MTHSAARATPSTAMPALLRSPIALLASALAVVAAILALPVSAPIGAMYWDVFIYYDAANRIFDGQVPVLDFFAPVGPLGYYLFAGWLAVFPDGQPTLLAHWSLLAVTAPLMALVLLQVDARSRATAFALLVPFLVFALLPFNGKEFYPFPGSDGFGIYNRQVCQVLYVLVAAFLFVKDQRVLAAVTGLCLLCLFFLKATGFVSALLICGFAFAAGRIALRAAVLSAAGVLGVLAALELATGIVSAYVGDILLLVEINSGGLLPRLVQAASINFGIVLPAVALMLLLLAIDRRRLAADLSQLGRRPFLSQIPAILDRDAFWIAAVLAAGIVFESQNTGSQAFIFLWPVLLRMLLRLTPFRTTMPMMAAAGVLAAAVAVPFFVSPVERAGRAYIGALGNQPLVHDNLKTLGAVNMRPHVRERAEKMLALYPGLQPQLAAFRAIGELPAPILPSDFDFQITHLMTFDRVIPAIRAFEADAGVEFETIMVLNFVNPLPWLMDRSAPRHISIGADPGRTVPEPGGPEAEAVSETDLVLEPKCPGTVATAQLQALYAPMLERHRKVEIDDCFSAYVHPRIDAGSAG